GGGYRARWGLPITLEMRGPGFDPRGGGQIVARIPACKTLRSVTMTGPVKLESASVLSMTAGLTDHVAKRQARRATVRLKDAGVEPEVAFEEWEGGPGCMLAIT